jgi:hypothetical protein
LLTRPHIDGLFEVLVMQIPDFDLQDLLNHVLADPFVAKNTLEHEIVQNGQFFKGFDFFHG